MTTLMIDGDTGLRYGSTTSKSSKRSKSQHQHAVLAAAAAGCVRYGWTREQFIEAMIDCPSRPGSCVREMSITSAHRRLDKIWERAQRHVPLHRPHGLPRGRHPEPGRPARQDLLRLLLARRGRLHGPCVC
jgi:hypothetical protein